MKPHFSPAMRLVTVTILAYLAVLLAAALGISELGDHSDTALGIATGAALISIFAGRFADDETLAKDRARLLPWISDLAAATALIAVLAVADEKATDKAMYREWAIAISAAGIIAAGLLALRANPSPKKLRSRAASGKRLSRAEWDVLVAAKEIESVSNPSPTAAQTPAIQWCRGAQFAPSGDPASLWRRMSEGEPITCRELAALVQAKYLEVGAERFRAI